MNYNSIRRLSDVQYIDYRIQVGAINYVNEINK